MYKKIQLTVGTIFVSRWNFSVGQHKLSLLNAHSDITRQREDGNTMQDIQVSIPEGIVAVVDKSENEGENIVWKQQFDTPVAAVWLVHNGVLEELDLLKIAAPPKSLNQNNEMPLMYYIGKKFYIITTVKHAI
jgi:hypothetical protein